MSLITNLELLRNELLDEIKLFYPDFSFEEGRDIRHSFTGSDCLISIDGKSYRFTLEVENDATDEEIKKKIKTFNKLSMYKALASYTGKEMSWGSLTGIRPTKLVYDMLKSGMRLDAAIGELCESYLVSTEKASIIREIIINQNLAQTREDNILFYVHIPFCKSICSYCAFTAQPIARNGKMVAEYAKNLVTEILEAREIVAKLGRKVSAVYIGGGTPTAIDDEAFELVLSSLNYKDVEITCEAGRPDTITQEKLRIMAKYGVNRLCVNPQTLNDKTLRLIGRSHTYSDFISCYKNARATGMDINVDLIAGLPNESFSDFEYSLNGILELIPDNITIHTLAIKNGAELKQNSRQMKSAEEGIITKMTDFAFERLTEEEYHPYYLYRQKHMAENLENIGYAKAGKQCWYNIASMEEAETVIACGAGGISKRLFEKGRIERHANVRDVKLYNEQHAMRLEKKNSFFLD